MSTLSIRIEEKTKKEAAKTLDALGLDLSTAVKMFLHQVVVEQGIPFKPSRNLVQIKAEWDKEVKEALHTGKSYSTARALLADARTD
jgi:DNA-damage-inducible protein J